MTESGHPQARPQAHLKAHDEPGAAAEATSLTHVAGYNKSRLEALSDGIFAVAMTLLVLDLKLGSDSAVDSEAGLVGRVLALEHTFVIYIVSFGVLAMLWITHLAQFHYVRLVNGRLIWINVFYLACVCLIPFSTRDHIGDMDFKVAGTAKGVTGIQMDIKILGISRAVW